VYVGFGVWIDVVDVAVNSIISPHVSPLLRYLKYRAKVRKIERNLTDKQEINEDIYVWYTQEDLNEAYLGPSFRLNYRYTQLLVNFSICWMYTISMPVLPIIGTISFYVSYWIDKFLFCNFYRIPPKYSDNIGRRSTKLIGLCIILHLSMSIWILGNQQILYGDNVFKKRDFKIPGNIKLKDITFKKHVMILESLFLVFIFTYACKRALFGFALSIDKCLRCMFCCNGYKLEKLKSLLNTVNVRFSNAKKRGVIKGLASYNILQNPKYQEAFGISPEFAITHRRLSSIRGLHTREGDLCLSEDISLNDNDSKVTI